METDIAPVPTEEEFASQLVPSKESQVPAVKKKRRSYRKTDPEFRAAVKRFVVEVSRHGNASEAYRQAFPDDKRSDGVTRVLAYRLLTKVNVQADLTRQRQKVERLGDAGLERIAELMAQDSDLPEAGRNARYAVDQSLGKAVQKQEVKGVFVHVEYDLTGGEDEAIDVKQ